MNVTTVYELFSVIMQETFQHNNDFSITYKTNLCRFTQMQVGKVKYVSVSAVECQDPKNSKNILWQKLCKRYEEMLPLSKNLTTELYPDWEHITYPDVNSRCEDFARQNIANSYLTHLNAGQQMIPPHLLMPYVEESIDYLQSEYGKNEYREKVLFLKKVFIDLNADDSIVRNIQPQFKTEEEPVINENTETDLEK